MRFVVAMAFPSRHTQTARKKRFENTEKQILFALFCGAKVALFAVFWSVRALFRFSPLFICNVL